ncbi:hypothetical protein C8Q70DRAFT_594482 [Cubamyces menziesii]|nr:hypothetical protein C8Q70DRAFT_594482 [Cubamyces menziesii]
MFASGDSAATMSWGAILNGLLFSSSALIVLCCEQLELSTLSDQPFFESSKSAGEFSIDGSSFSVRLLQTREK